MRGLARLALRLLTGVSTVFIAACYGVRNLGPEPSRRGRVEDSTSGARIPGILVSCRRAARVVDQDTTDAGGEFVLPLACDEYGAEDVDGPANGRYDSRIDPAPAGTTEPVVIRLAPSPN